MASRDHGIEGEKKALGIGHLASARGGAGSIGGGANRLVSEAIRIRTSHAKPTRDQAATVSRSPGLAPNGGLSNDHDRM